jgi:Uma2 family endonuclease
MATALDEAMKVRGCIVLSSDQRVRTRERHYGYPDLTVVCGALALADGDVIENPTMLVEVLSPSTEQYDRGLKWDDYQELPSLTDYLLVSQDRARIAHFARRGQEWRYVAANAGGQISLTNGIVLDVDAVFAGAFELPGG